MNEAKRLGSTRGDTGAVIRVESPKLNGSFRVDELPESLRVDFRTVVNARDLKPDTVVQALQSSGFRRAVTDDAERLGRQVNGAPSFDRGFEQFVRQFNDPLVRRLFEVNKDFFRP